MESEEVEGAAAPMDAETVATTPSTKLLNGAVEELGLKQQTNDCLVSKLITFAKTHCSGSTYNVTTFVPRVQKHLGSVMSSRSKHHIVGSLKVAESEIRKARFTKAAHMCRNILAIISFLESEPDAFTQGQADVQAEGGGGSGAAESHKTQDMADTASGAPTRGGELVDEDVDDRKPAAQVAPPPETEELQPEAAPALHGQGEHQAQTDGTQWVYGVGGAREIGEGQICVPSSGWYFTLDYHFDKQNRARVTEHIRAVVRMVSPGDIVKWHTLHVNTDDKDQLAEMFFRPHALRFSHGYLAIKARNMRMPVAKNMRTLFKYMLGEQNAALWMTEEAQQRERDDIDQKLTKANEREAKRAAAPIVMRQTERERRKSKRVRDDDN